VPRWVALLAIPGRIPGLGDFVRWVLTGFGQISPRMNPKAAGLLKYGGTYAGAYLLRRGLFMPWELGSILGPDATRLGLRRLKPLRHIQARMKPQPRTSFGKVAVLESSLYMRNQLLRDTDWASMAHSLEVRVPLVDVKLLRRLAFITTKKGSLSKRMLGSSPRVPLPSKVIERSKTGFGTPIQAWLQHEPRIQKGQQGPTRLVNKCTWARRWAFEVCGGLAGA
jgi:asparagine synthase (glutamine-hydrolysing)